MNDFLNDFKLEQLLSTCESLYNSNKYEALVSNLKDFKRLFRPDFINKISSTFKPPLLKKQLLSIIKFLSSKDKSVSEAAKSLLLHICPILSVINPIKFIETLKELQKNQVTALNLNYFFALILPSICYALKTFDESNKMQSFSFLLSIFQNSQDYIELPFLISSEIDQNNSNEFYVNNIFDVSKHHDTCDIPIAIFSKYAPLNELEKLISLNSILLDDSSDQPKNPENIDLLGNQSNENEPIKLNEVDAKKEAEIELYIQKKAILSARICNFREEIVKPILSNVQELETSQRIQFFLYFVRFLHQKLLFSTILALNLIDRIYLKLKHFFQPEFEPIISIFTLIVEKYRKPAEGEEGKLDNKKVVANKLTMICENLIDIIKKNKIKFSLFNKILNVLYKSARSECSLIDRTVILPFIKNASSSPNDEYRLISLKVMFLFPDKEEVLNILAPFLLTFHNFQTNVYSEYLSTLEENLPLIDDEMLTLIVNDSVNPLPLLPLSAYSILKFLNAIPKRIFLKENLNLNVYALVDKYLLINDQKVQSELAKFVEKVNVSPRLSNPNLDFFSEKSSTYLILNASKNVYSEINLSFLNELLEYRLIHPNNLIYALDIIQKFAQPANYNQYFRKVLNLLVCELKILGFNLPKLYKELNLPFSMSNFNYVSGSAKDSKESKVNIKLDKDDQNIEFDHLWILNSDLVNMFAQIDSTTKFENSLFGKLLFKTLETLKVIYQPNYESEVAILTSCTSSIFCGLSLDIIENKINKSSKDLNEIIKILCEVPLPMSESVRISQFVVHCLTVKTALSKFLPYLREGAEQSREIADFFSLHSTPQSFTKPIPTFLSFVDGEAETPENKTILFKKVSDSKTAMSKWNNYVDLCQQVLEPETWVILKDDRERIKRLTDYKNGYIERALKRLPEEPDDENASDDQDNEMNKQEPLVNDLEIFEIDERAMHFRLDKKWQKEESLYELTMFLWHSSGIKERIDSDLISEFESECDLTLALNKDEVIGGIQKKFKTDRKGLQYMSYMEIEEIALNGAGKDSFVDLLIGFFNYSSVNHKEIQVKRWLDALQVTNYDKKHILMIALFFENVHCKFSKLPRQISILAQNALTSFGYPLMTKPLLILAYLQLTGIQWFFVRSIIGIDPEFFKEFPIIAFDFNINKPKAEQAESVNPKDAKSEAKDSKSETKDVKSETEDAKSEAKDDGDEDAKEDNNNNNNENGSGDDKKKRKAKSKKHEFMISNGTSLTLFDYYVSLSQTLFDPNDKMADFDLDYYYSKDSDESSIYYHYDSGMEFINNELCISPPWSVPSNRKWPSKMKTFLHSHIKVGYSNMIELSDAVFDDIISKVKAKANTNDSNNTIPEIFYILMNTKLTNRQRRVVEEVFLTKAKDEPKESNLSSIIKSIEFLENLNNEYNTSNILYSRSLRKYYSPYLLTLVNQDNTITPSNANSSFKSSPSFTLKVFRTLLCQFAKPVPQNMIHNYARKQSPVHPSCCYETFAKQGIHCWIPKKQKYESPTCCANFELDYATFKNSVLDNSRAGLFDPTILSLLRVVSDELISTLLFLFSLDERDLIQLKDTEIGSIDVIKTDILRTVFQTVSNSPESNVYFASKVMKAIKILLKNNLILIDDLSTLICNRDFLNSPNFLPTAFVFLSLEKMAKSLDRDDIVSFCKVLKSEEAEVFEKSDNWKRKFFADYSNPSVIIETFHHY